MLHRCRGFYPRCETAWLPPLVGPFRAFSSGLKAMSPRQRDETYISVRDPEKWAPVSCLREALAQPFRLGRCFGGRRQVGQDHAQTKDWRSRPPASPGAAAPRRGCASLRDILLPFAG